MPIQLLPLRIPEEAVSDENSRPYLVDFIYWLRDFLDDIASISHEIDPSTGNPLFEESQIFFLKDVLFEVKERQHFENVVKLIHAAQASALIDHGLEGIQLKWKLSNINFWFGRFIDGRTAALLERLLHSIDTLLKSILGAVGAGSALEELKESVLNSMTLVTE